MRVMTNHTIYDDVFALEQLIVLFVMLNEAIFGINLGEIAGTMTLGTRGRATINFHTIG